MPCPLHLGLDLVHRLSEEDDFEDKADATGKPPAPPHLKILASLRVLGRSECFDTCYELSNIHAETLRTFFLKFIKYISCLYGEYIKSPSTPTEINYAARQYELLVPTWPQVRTSAALIEAYDFSNTIYRKRRIILAC